MARKPTKLNSQHVLPNARGYAMGGLGKWFGEEWTDVKTGKPCGRSKGDAQIWWDTWELSCWRGLALSSLCQALSTILLD